MTEIIKAIGLLKSMVYGGENHTKQSLDQINKAYDEHENIIAEVERLKQENKKLIIFRDISIKSGSNLLKNNEQLREALKECSPDWTGMCSFCRTRSKIYGNHSDDCEYIRLIGGVEND